MKGKDVWTTRFSFEYNELDSLTEFLEQKYADGWELTSYGGQRFGFRKADPRTVQINVEIVENADDENEKQRFIQYCEADGWKHLFDGGQLQFFENQDIDAEPIHTDDEVKLKLVHRKCLKSRVLPSFIGAILVFVYAAHTAWSLSFYQLFDSINTVILVAFPLLGLMVIFSTIDYFIWYGRAKQAILRGETPSYRKTKVSLLLEHLFMILVPVNIWGYIFLDAYYGHSVRLMVIAMGCMVLTYLFVAVYEYWEAKTNYDKRGNNLRFLAFGIVFVVMISWIGFVFIGDEDGYKTDGKLIITVEELGIVSDGSKETTVYYEGSPLVQSEEGYDRWGTNRIEYDLYTTKSDKIYQMILVKRFFGYDRGYEPVNEPSFRANQVYLMGQAVGLTQWLLQYDDRILYIETTIDLTDQQKGMIGERLSR